MLAAVLMSAPALPELTAVDREDIRCFIVAAEMANDDDKELETAGSVMLFYFLGKLDGRNLEEKLDEAIAGEAGRMTEADKMQLLASCAAQVEQRGKQLSAPTQ